MIPPEDALAIAEHAARFARERLGPLAAEWDREHRYPTEAIAAMGELGFLGMLVPEAFGGGDVGELAYVMAIEEIAAGDGACSTIMSVHNSAASMPILRYGSDAQKQRFLPKMASGEWIGGFALTEADAGSDAAAIRTRARRDGGSYIIDGTKQFITSGATAKLLILFAQTDASAGKRGISAFIVPTDTPGYKVIGTERKLGQHASDTCSLAFDDMRVPAEFLLGQEGEGYRIALSSLEGGRIGIAAQSVGMARAAFDHARIYAGQRKSFGKALRDHDAVALRLADMATSIAAARQLVHHAAAVKQAGRPALSEASMAKLFASEMAERVCSDAIQIHGGYGYLTGAAVERIYRDVRACQIYEGASDIQRLLIARNLER